MLRLTLMSEAKVLAQKPAPPVAIRQAAVNAGIDMENGCRYCNEAFALCH